MRTDGRLTEIPIIMTLTALEVTAQILYHNVFMPDAE